MEIVQGDDERALLGQPADQSRYALEQPAARFLGIHGHPDAGRLRHLNCQLGHQARYLPQPQGRDGRVQRFKGGMGAADGLDQRLVGRGAVGLVGVAGQQVHVFSRFDNLLHQPGFADPHFPIYQHQLSPTLPRSFQGSPQRLCLPLPTDQRGPQILGDGACLKTGLEER